MLRSLWRPGTRYYKNVMLRRKKIPVWPSCVQTNYNGPIETTPYLPAGVVQRDKEIKLDDKYRLTVFKAFLS